MALCFITCRTRDRIRRLVGVIILGSLGVILVRLVDGCVVVMERVLVDHPK
jgi:hypothetical protein